MGHGLPQMEDKHFSLMFADTPAAVGFFDMAINALFGFSCSQVKIRKNS
jgi:hypothetical protein